MAEHSKIEWTQATWNPVRGCSKVSEGCRNCYAMNIAARFSGPGLPYEGLAERRGGKAQWTNQVIIVEDSLTLPLTWKAPRRIFVNSMSDLFHEDVPQEFIYRISHIMLKTPQHTYQVLTKRPERMASVWLTPLHCEWLREKIGNHLLTDANIRHMLRHVWMGTSVEDQAAADTRIPELLQVPAPVRFLSCEPLLGPVDLTDWLEREGDEVAQSHGRERRVPRSGSWGADDRRIGASLAAGESAMESLAETVGVSSIPATESRTRDGELSSGPGDAEREAVSRLGASSRLATSAWPNSAGIDGQPQERGQSGQSSLQSGACDLLSAATSRDPHSEDLFSSEPMGQEQSHGEADHGTSVGNQNAANGRGEAEVDGFGLRSIPTSNFQDSSRRPTISWIIVGGESGPGARPMHPDWARSLRDQSVASGVPFFFKQWGHHAPGRDLPEGVFSEDYTNDDTMYRVGKKAAGRTLDGREWDEMPGSSDVPAHELGDPAQKVEAV